MIGIQPHFGPEDPDGPALLAGIVRSSLPLIEKTGVAKAEEMRIESLEERLKQEFKLQNVVFAHPSLVSAWAMKNDH